MMHDNAAGNWEVQMGTYGSIQHRRGFLKGLGGLGLSAPLFATPGLFAEKLTLTASLTEARFYPDRMPLDTDNDLLIVNNAITPAVGEITHLGGRVLSSSGEPIRNMFRSE